MSGRERVGSEKQGKAKCNKHKTRRTDSNANTHTERERESEREGAMHYYSAGHNQSAAASKILVKVYVAMPVVVATC